MTREHREAAMRADVREGLWARPRSIPPVWFYDETGSKLFDEITRLPEYYLTRSERSILSVCAGEITEASGADTLVELGSGTSEKTVLLLDAMASHGALRRVVLLDISEEILHEAAEGIARRYDVDVHAVVGDFRTDLSRLPREGRQLWAFLGSTIGNFTPSACASMFAGLRSVLGGEGHLLLGTDLVKDESAGSRLRRRVRGDGPVQPQRARRAQRRLGLRFRPWPLRAHRALDDTDQWIEMRLRALDDNRVQIPSLGVALDIAHGEEILTEISAKFDPERLERELSSAGLRTSAGGVTLRAISS